MKIGHISKPNKKGQVVIPSEIRNALEITSEVPLNFIIRDNGVYMYPIKEVIYSHELESSYVAILRKTQGGWGKDNWNKTRKKRKKTELGASGRRRKIW